jgi:hypothetical protein
MEVSRSSDDFKLTSDLELKGNDDAQPMNIVVIFYPSTPSLPLPYHIVMQGEIFVCEPI